MILPYSFVMVKRYRRYHRRSSGYSVEHTLIRPPTGQDWVSVEASDETEVNSYQYSVSVIPPTNTEGKRKVKHLTLSFASMNSSSTAAGAFFAVVFVPQGYTAQPIHFPNNGYAVDMYEANQYVLCSGVLDFSAGPLRIRSNVSKNLDSGDSIYLIIADFDTNNPPLFMTQVTYAIKYD